jgi:NADH-quinone oxidoreductase subunit N
MALTAVAFYLCAYFATTLAAFGVVSVLSGSGREAEELDDYVGLARRRPMVAAVFVVAILSLAGMPLTAGFIGKFYLLAAGVGSGLWLLVGALAVNSVIALFYYLRFVAAVFRRAGEGSWGMLSEAKPSHVAVSAARSTYFGSVALAATVVTLVYLGVYPSPAIKAIQAFMAGLTP